MNEMKGRRDGRNKCMNEYVCVCVCIYIYIIYLHIYVYVYVYIYIYVYSCYLSYVRILLYGMQLRRLWRSSSVCRFLCTCVPGAAGS